MKRIARVTIENFQSHERSELFFGPGLNVIVGPSDNGKSAVLRAVRWALYNEPRGTEFVRAGARECRVGVVMSDGAEIIREAHLTKSGATTRNRYTVRLPDSEPQVFEGFGTEVPAEVSRAHGMEQVLLDADKRVMLNFGTQLEGPFLMAETGSFRARAIGRLMGVHVVDAAVRGAQRDLKAVRLDMGRLEREAARLEQQLLPFANVSEQELALKRAEGLLGRAEALEARKGRLEQLAADMRRVEAEMAQSQLWVDTLTALPVAEEGLRRLERLQEKLAPLLEAETGLAEAAAGLHRAEADLAARLAEYESVLRGLGRCPTCLQPVEPEAILRILAELAGGPGSGHSH